MVRGEGIRGLFELHGAIRDRDRRSRVRVVSRIVEKAWRDAGFHCRAQSVEACDDEVVRIVVDQRGRLHRGPVFELDGNTQALRLLQSGPSGTTNTAPPDKLNDLRRVRWALAADSGVVG